MPDIRSSSEERPRGKRNCFPPSALYIVFLKWISILSLPLLLAACGGKEEIFRQESFVFGTRVEISIAGAEEGRAKTAAASVLQRFDALHRKLHAWQPSELTQVNAAVAAGKKQPIDAELAAILQDAKTHSLNEGELFNPAIGELIGLWGFHADLPPNHVPHPQEISRLVSAAPSMRDLHIENGLIWSTNPAVRLDLGGYAKGYALDEAVAILQRQGIRNALVNIGGNVIALGKAGNRPWKVGIQHPRKAGIIATLDLQDGEAIGTSGDYQRFFEAGGQRYCHLIDPRTGWPATDMQSVTVLVSGKQAGGRSDVLSKPLFIGGVRHLAQAGTSHVLAIDAKGKVLATSNMLARLQWQAPGQVYELLPALAVR